MSGLLSRIAAAMRAANPAPAPAAPPAPPAPPPFKRELTAQDFERAARELAVPVAAVRAVAEVESRGSGFLPAPDTRPTILYEAHVFHRLTSGRHRMAVDRRGVALSVPRWDRSLYGSAGARQWERLEDAAKLDAEAAHASCSWGIFQVLGSNAKSLGYPSAQDFAREMARGADAHLDALVRFIRSNGLADELRSRDWAGFAARYNGPRFRENRYDEKLAAAFARWSRA